MPHKKQAQDLQDQKEAHRTVPNQSQQWRNPAEIANMNTAFFLCMVEWDESRPTFKLPHIDCVSAEFRIVFQKMV